jgi:thiamine biosynthesis lipoprotein ApbE
MLRTYIVLVIVGLLAVVVPSCKSKPAAVPMVGRYYTGVLFGKPYAIDVVGDSADYRASIDSIVLVYESLFNTLDPNSLLARINSFSSRDSMFTFVDSTHAFGLVYDWAKDLHRNTLQYYDPTIAPLKRAWLVTKSKGELEPNLDSLYAFVGFDHSDKGEVLIPIQSHRFEKRMHALSLTLQSWPERLRLMQLVLFSRKEVCLNSALSMAAV